MSRSSLALPALVVVLAAACITSVRAPGYDHKIERVLIVQEPPPAAFGSFAQDRLPEYVRALDERLRGLVPATRLLIIEPAALDPEASIRDAANELRATHVLIARAAGLVRRTGYTGITLQLDLRDTALNRQVWTAEGDTRGTTRTIVDFVGVMRKDGLLPPER